VIMSLQLGLGQLEWEKYVEIDEKYERPTEVDALIGDPSKVKKVLGWSAKTYWQELARLMVDYDLGSK
jgi:GDPmannose 4,6-dehydratase